jgi:hypothetical protein
MYERRKEASYLNKEQKRKNEHNTVDKTEQQRKEGYTGDKKLGGPNRPAE